MKGYRRRGSIFWSASIAGLASATGVIILAGFLIPDVYESLGESVIAGILALGAGSGAAAVVDGKRLQRYVEVVAIYLLLMAAAYILVLPTLKWLLTGTHNAIR